MACFTNQNGGEMVSISPGKMFLTGIMFLLCTYNNILNKVFTPCAMLNSIRLGKSWCMVKKDSPTL